MIFSTTACADTVYTRDKRTWQGLIIAENKHQVWLDLGFDIAIIKKEKIIRILRSDSQTAKNISAELKTKRQKRNQMLLSRDQKPREVPFETFQGHILVQALLNGHVKSKLLLDTGSTFTFLSQEIASKLGIPNDNKGLAAQVMTSDGRSQKMLVSTLRTVRVGTAEARDVMVAILPKMREKTPFADGLLGVSFLSRYNFKIDYKRSKLILEQNRPNELPKT